MKRSFKMVNISFNIEKLDELINELEMLKKTSKTKFEDLVDFDFDPELDISDEIDNRLQLTIISVLKNLFDENNDFLTSFKKIQIKGIKNFNVENSLGILKSAKENIRIPKNYLLNEIKNFKIKLFENLEFWNNDNDNINNLYYEEKRTLILTNLSEDSPYFFLKSCKTINDLSIQIKENGNCYKDYKKFISDEFDKIINFLEKNNGDLKKKLEYGENLFENFNDEDIFYKNLIQEINTLYKVKCFTSCFIMCRKLFENKIIQVMRKFKLNENQYWDDNKNRFLDFSVLLKKLEKNLQIFNSFNDEVKKICEDINRVLIKPMNKTAHSIIENIKEKDFNKNYKKIVIELYTLFQKILK